MRIKVKNKYLILGIAFLLLAFGIVKVAGAEFLFYRAESARQDGNYVKALAHYDAFIERFPDHEKIPEALYWSADLLPGTDVFAATFFSNRSSISRRVGAIPEVKAGALTQEERYLRILNEFPEHWAARHGKFRLAEIYRMKGDPKAEELFLETLYNGSSSERISAGDRLIDMYINAGRFDEALAIVDYCQTHLPGHLPADIQMRLGDIHAAMGNYDLAQAAYGDVLPIVAEQFRDRSHHFGEQEGSNVKESTMLHYQEQLEKRLAMLPLLGHGEYIAVDGIVTVLDEPFPGINVFANLVTEEYWVSSRNVPTQWVTDANGHFGGELLSGSYEFGIQLNYEQASLVEGTHLRIINGSLVLDKDQQIPMVEFRFVDPVKLNQPTQDYEYVGEPIPIDWDPYPEASQYRLLVSGIVMQDNGYSSTSNNVAVLNETSYLYDRNNVGAFGVYGGDQDGIDPVYFLNGLTAYDRLRFKVQALDEQGFVLSSSDSLVFDESSNIQGEIPIKKRELNRVEELLISREYDQAVEMLEERIDNNPSDIGALWMLARIYYYGTYNLAGSWENEIMAHRDLEKSLATLELINELDPGVEVWNAQIIVLRALGRHDGLLELHQKIVSSDQAGWDSYNYLAYHTLEHDSNIPEALRLYEVARNCDPEYYGFLDYYRLLMLLGEINEAITVVENSGVRMDSRIMRLLNTTKGLRDSGRLDIEIGKHLSIDDSYSEALLSWEKSGDVYEKFLALVARVLEPNQFDKEYRNEIRAEVDSFIAERGDHEPELADYLQALVDYSF